MRLTKRDINWLKAINGFGFVDIDYLISIANIHRSVIYRRLRKLISADYLCHEWLLHGKPGIYRATKLGTEISHDVLPPIKKIALATCEHHLKVANLSSVLLKKFGGEFITERHLRHQAGLSGVGQKTHMCDGALILPDKRIAIEVELTPKSKCRLEKIINHYRKDFQYQEVWYFCGNNEVRNKIETAASNTRFIKCLNLNEFSQPLKETI